MIYEDTPELRRKTTSSTTFSDSNSSGLCECAIYEGMSVKCVDVRGDVGLYTFPVFNRLPLAIID